MLRLAAEWEQRMYPPATYSLILASLLRLSMKKWILKAIVQKLFGIIPGGFKLNYLFQKYVSKAVVLSDEFFETMLDHFQELQQYSSKHGFVIENSRVFEIGTGWHPIVPFCFALSGSREVITLDLNPHLRSENLQSLMQKLQEYRSSGKLLRWLPAIDENRWQKLQELANKPETLSVETTLSALGITQHIMDAAHSGLKGESFDMCYSVNVYEHIDQSALPGITEELSRITRPGGFGYHAIGVYDHFVHIDSTISKFNYLRFSKKEWKVIDNKIQPQNRLRLSYFRELFEKNHLFALEEIFQPAEPEEIERIRLHPDWHGVEDLDVPYGTFVVKKVIG